MTRGPVVAPIDVPAGDKRQVFGWCFPIALVNANRKMQRAGGLSSIIASFCDPGVYHSILTNRCRPSSCYLPVTIDDVTSALSSWSGFAERSLLKYGVDMAGLDKAYDTECVEFFSLSSAWRELSNHQVLSEPATVKGEYNTAGTQRFGSCKKHEAVLL